jgi:nucleoid-associated protein YgaU
MKQDLKLGLLLTVVLALVLTPRFLPKFEFASTVSDAKPDSAPEPPATAAAPPKLPENDAPPVVAAPTPKPSPAKSDALTTVFPDGYHEKTPAPETKKEPKPAAEPEKPSKPKAPKKEEDFPALPGIDDGPTFLVDNEKDSAVDADLALPVLFGEEDSDTTEVADSKSKLAKSPAESKPAVDALALPGLDEMDEKDVVAKDADDSSEESPYVPVSTSIVENKSSDRSKKSKVEAPSRTFAEDRNDDKPATKPDAAKKFAAKPPVHPYFERYLERKEYFVRPGDTLENIAQRLYQDPKLADYLFEKNRELLNSPDELKPGMKLRLP